MSSPFTDTFKLYWRNGSTRAPIVLAKVEVTLPAAFTLYVATREVTTPDGQTWESGLRCDSLRARLATLDPGPSPADGTIYLANRFYSMISGARLDRQIAANKFQGAKVTLYLWNDVRNPDTGLQRLASADAGCILKSARVDSYESDDAEIKLTLLQDQSWNNPVPDKVVDKNLYPLAPDVSQGRPIPIGYGDFSALKMRAPWTTAYGSKQRQEDLGAGQGVVPMLLVDPGLGAAKVKLVAAGHACLDVLDRANGLTQFVVANDVLAPLDTAGITEVLGAGESYVTINDDTLIAYYGVRPLEPRGTYNTADNARRAADPFDETTFATIDQGAGKGVLELSLPSVGSLGFIETVDVFVAYVGNAGNTSTLRVRPQVPGGANGTAITATLADSQAVTPKILTGTWDTAYWNDQSWRFGGVNTGVPWDIRIDFTAGTTNKASVLFAGLRVKFRPQRSLVTPAYINGGVFAGLPINPQTQYASSFEQQVLAAGRSTFRGARLELSGQFFANVKFFADDGTFGTAGSFTGGSSTTLIERPCDIVRHFLVAYGGVAGADIETGANAFGSFVAARDQLRNAAPTDYKLACWIGEKSSVQRTIQQMAQQSLGCVLIDRFTGKWMFHVWRRQPAVDYDLAFERTDLPGLFQCGVLSDVGLAQGVRVRWAYDYFRNRTLFETFVNSTGSSQGYALPTVHDQVLTVATGVNDKMDLSNGVTPITVTLTPGTYRPSALAAHLQAQIRAAAAWSAIFQVKWGFAIVTGFNDKLDIRVGSTTYTATMNAGDYTADTLAAEAARALNTIVGTGLAFAVSYSQSTNKFTIDATGGTFKVYEYSGPNRSVTGWFALGFNGDTAVAAASLTGGAATYAGYFGLRTGSAGGAFVYWNTGASTATCCAELLGYSKLADTTITGATTSYAALTRGERETLCAASEAAFGPRADNEIVADWVRDESSAQRLRDGIFDFGKTPRAWVRFRTYACPDIRRMETFQFSADVDSRRPFPVYGSDGSWARKVFRALEVEQSLGPSFHTEVYAEEA